MPHSIFHYVLCFVWWICIFYLCTEGHFILKYLLFKILLCMAFLKISFLYLWFSNPKSIPFHIKHIWHHIVLNGVWFLAQYLQIFYSARLHIANWIDLQKYVVRTGDTGLIPEAFALCCRCHVSAFLKTEATRRTFSWAHTSAKAKQSFTPVQLLQLKNFKNLLQILETHRFRLNRYVLFFNISIQASLSDELTNKNWKNALRISV